MAVAEGWEHRTIAHFLNTIVPGDRTFDLLEGIRAACRTIAEAGGGELLHEQEWSDDRRMLGVHPLSGCRMARSRAAGVVDARAEVFGYPGLYVVDGSIMPSAIGVNPSLTISAVAEKLSDGIRDELRESVGRRVHGTAR